MELTSKMGNFCQRHLLLLLLTVATTPQFPVGVTASMSPAWATSFCPRHSRPGSLETTFILPALLHALEPLGVKDATDVQLLWKGFLLQKRNPHGQTIIIPGHEFSTARHQWQEMMITPGGACYLCQILGCSSSTFLISHPLPFKQDMRPCGCTTHAQTQIHWIYSSAVKLPPCKSISCLPIKWQHANQQQTKTLWDHAVSLQWQKGHWHFKFWFGAAVQLWRKCPDVPHWWQKAGFVCIAWCALTSFLPEQQNQKFCSRCAANCSNRYCLAGTFRPLNLLWSQSCPSHP